MLFRSVQPPAPVEGAKPGQAAFDPGASGQAEKALRSQAKEAPPAVLEGPGAEVAGGLTLQLIQDHWRQVMPVLKRRSPNAEALLKSGRVLGVKDGVLYIGFSEVLKSKMEKSDNMDSVRQAFQEVLKMDVPIRCIVTTGKAGSIPADIESDGMVAAAVRDLGGEIVDVQ